MCVLNGVFKQQIQKQKMTQIGTKETGGATIILVNYHQLERTW